MHERKVVMAKKGKGKKGKGKKGKSAAPK
eukprot:COSAG06_NODE_59426_length_274_cov_0.594286_1_plen_28_part_01